MIALAARRLVLVLGILGAFGYTACGDARPARALRAEQPAQVSEHDTTVAAVAAQIDTVDLATTRACNNRDYLPTALTMIESATSEIQVSQFLFVYGNSIRQLQQALGEAAQRGVRVRVLVDEESDKSVRSIEYLRRLGIEAAVDSPTKRTHTKLIIVDGRWALAGSTNWSDASIESNNESNLFLADSVLVAGLQRYYEALWSQPQTDVFLPAVTADHITLLFDRAYETAAMDLLHRASRIDLQIYAARLYAADPNSPSTRAIMAAVDAARSGRPVRAIIEESDYNDDGNRLCGEVVAVMKAGGVDVRRDPLTVTSHTKLLITDRAVLLGSTNWGFGAFRQYHELNFRIENPRVAQEFRNYYEALWADAQ